MKIVIDPGHGGQDPGAVGLTGVREKDVTLVVSLKLADILQSAGAEVRLTREDDSEPSLAGRVAISNAFGSAVFISLHANAFSNPAAEGLEVWTSRGQTESDPLAESIANALQAAFPDMVFRSDISDGDQDKESNFYVLRWTDAPAVLVEMGFITNPTEEELLASADYQARVARAIAEGLAGHLGLTLLALVGQDATTEAVGILQAAGVIGSPDYWLQNARPGKVASGEYVGMLIQNVAKQLGNR